MGATAYEVIGVAETASDREIRAAGRRQAFDLHPDRGGDAERFHLVMRARALLEDPASRAAYDARLARLRARRGGPGPEARAPRARRGIAVDDLVRISRGIAEVLEAVERAREAIERTRGGRG